ncbi:hypothetical protein EV360DRAFT_90741 [Lentinula raphanica]|nr:hypothetical protein EV360DRAFT_90741 [Lentinula raphanica]
MPSWQPGQFWNIISIDKKQSTDDLGLLGKFFWDPHPILLYYLIAPTMPSTSKPKNSHCGKNSKSQEMVSKVRSNATSVALLALPVELLLIIAEDLEQDYLHLLCFSLTCTLLWEVTGQSRYRSLYSRLKHESWAGSRVILLGDYLETLPEGLLTEEDIKYLQEIKPERDVLDDPKSGRAFYNAVLGYYRVLPPPERFLVLDDRRVKEDRNFWRELTSPPYEDERFRRWILARPCDFIPVPQPGDRWMLRSLSKREYVTLAWIDNMEQVIYTLIGRSDDPSVDMHGGDWLIEGPWAGDRIDITLVSTHEKERGDEEDWKEITRGAHECQLGCTRDS